MKPGIGWMHIKDYRHPQTIEKNSQVNEDILKNFVPADLGQAAHEAILRDFRDALPKLSAKLKRRGIPGVFLDLEPQNVDDLAVKIVELWQNSSRRESLRIRAAAFIEQNNWDVRKGGYLDLVDRLVGQAALREEIA